jgi:transposase InsO family protein
MDLKLHANATTTPKTRAYIQASRAPTAQLALELGISERTVARWRSRSSVSDRSHRPHRIATTMTPLEERLAVELRTSIALPLDDIVEVLRRCVNAKLSRSQVHRCLQRHGVSAKPKRDREKPAAFQVETPAGFVHLDVKYLPPLHRKRAYAYVAIDRATRFVYVEILYDRRGDTAAAFLRRFLDAFKIDVHTVLSDNGSEWTDRYAVDKKNKPKDRPSGQHPVDRLCAQRGIQHKLTRPFRPQTNGMVERFNRRLGEHLEKLPRNAAGHHRRFETHEERNAYLMTFVENYNRTRLKCLDYLAPIEAVANLPGPNTKAGTHGYGPDDGLTSMRLPIRGTRAPQQRMLVVGAGLRRHDGRLAFAGVTWTVAPPREPAISVQDRPPPRTPPSSPHTHI